MKIRIGLMPTRREIFAPENAKKEYERIMPIIRSLCPEHVEWGGIEDVCEDGLAQMQADITRVVEPFIHHCAGVYGHYFAEMREIARYLQELGTHLTVFFEYPEKEGYYSL